MTEIKNEAANFRGIRMSLHAPALRHTCGHCLKQ